MAARHWIVLRGLGGVLGLALFLMPGVSPAADTQSGQPPAQSSAQAPAKATTNGKPDPLMAGHKIVFNCDKSAYPDIRKQIYQHEAKLYETVETPAFLKAMPSARNGDYCLALADLQDNGEQDVIAYANFGSYFCSATTPVCLTKVIVNDKDNVWRNVLNVMLSMDGFMILDQKANGYHLFKTYGYNTLKTQMKTGEPARQYTIWYYDPKQKQYVAFVPKTH